MYSTGVSIIAGYRRSTAVCLDFINENKNDINKKKEIQQQRQPLKFVNATKKRAKQTQGQKTEAHAIILWSIKMPINSTLFDAQNAGNRISELLDFKFFLGGHATRPP